MYDEVYVDFPLDPNLDGSLWQTKDTEPQFLDRFIVTPDGCLFWCSWETSNDAEKWDLLPPEFYPASGIMDILGSTGPYFGLGEREFPLYSLLFLKGQLQAVFKKPDEMDELEDFLEEHPEIPDKPLRREGEDEDDD
jgi:hypothetical protein